MKKTFFKGVAAVLLVSALLFLTRERKEPDDAVLYRRWHQTTLVSGTLRLCHRCLPHAVCQLLRLPAVESVVTRRQWEKDETIKEHLLASGYLAKQWVDLKSSGQARRQVLARLDKTAHANGVKYEVPVFNNAEMSIICRPTDLHLLEAALKRE